MKPVKVVTPVLGDPDAPTQNLVGVGALAAELAAQGISVRDLFARTGVDAGQLEDVHARISHRQRLAIYRNARRVAKRSDIGLLAGARQRISDYGIYGYAMVSSRTFGDALLFSLDHVTMAGPAVRQISFRIEGGTMAILRSHGLDTLGDLLPFAAEFWRSSVTALFSRVLEAPFPSKRMVFPFPAPVHWRNYERIFNCPVDFDADRMEWHFDASVLELPCPNANPITAKICQQVCEVVLTEHPDDSGLVRKIRAACLNNPNRFPVAADIASELGLSLRTFHRRLAEEGTSYQSIVDGMRRSLATELLENTHMSIDQVAERIGFADATSFRKAFKKWTNRSPTDFRHPDRGRQAQATACEQQDA
ncbi:MAG: AraC family transcriptional regulator [Bradyrhizobium sp.]